MTPLQEKIRATLKALQTLDWERSQRQIIHDQNRFRNSEVSAIGDIQTFVADLAAFMQKMEELARQGDRGEKGESGYTPRKGVDYLTPQELQEIINEVTPIKDVHYFDGRDGKDGTDGKSIKGPKGETGTDGSDGTDADPEAVIPLVKEELKLHEKAFDHATLHSPFVLGTKTVNENGMEKGMFLQFNGKDELTYLKVQQLAQKLHPYMGLRAGSTWGTVPSAYVAKTASYSVGGSDFTIDCTANSFTITLPTAVEISGKIYNIKNSGTGTITMATTSSQTIDGGASGTISLYQYDCLSVASNGANWLIL